MGNQITAKTPYEILPVERYFTSLPNTTYEVSLGSTRFLKVAKAQTADGRTLVVKVFVIQDPSMSLKKYSQDIDYITEHLSAPTNCLPYQYNVISDKAGFLVRQYIKYNLYDRISTRPFLSTIEKKWIAFQLFSALNQCAQQKICHGDIKSENVLLTSWNWVLLSDFANYKPTYLPENNPSDYNYFFDTSRRRTCYIAPERFKQGWTGKSASEPGQFDLLSTEDPQAIGGELTHAMDVFSLGCVLIELFSEGKVAFNLSQLLSYRKGDYSPWKILDSISDRHVKELLTHMIQRNPSHRLSCNEYLLQQRAKTFPSYFYDYLRGYMQSYRPPSMLPDDRVHKISKDLASIMRNMGVTKGQDGEYEPLILILDVLTASIRELKYCENKLTSLRLLLEFAEYLPADITLDRIIPHMMHLMEETIPRVKAEAIRVVTLTLANISYVPKREANIFPDYVLPAMNNLTSHASVVVRVALAENIATLAETAVRYLNLSQAAADTADCNQVDYELELKTLHDLIQVKVVSLLSDADNSVKMAMLHSSIIKLAIIFGKQKASDVILSHMITFLNDKRDWKLRAEFFQCVVGIASYIGWQSTTVLKPLIEQGLSDPEEFVIRKSLEALDTLLAIRLMHKSMVHRLLEDISPLLCHPNQWIRYGVAKCVTTVGSTWSTADVYCHVMPTIRQFLRRPVLQINRLDVLLHSLHEPLPRAVLDFLVKSSHLSKFFSSLQDRQLQRNLVKPGHEPVYTTQEEHIRQMCKKLNSLGLTEEQEDRLLRMREFIIKLHGQHCAGTGDVVPCKPGQIDISLMWIQRRHADLIKPEISQQDLSQSKPLRQKSISDQSAVAPADVRLLFTGTDILDDPLITPDTTTTTTTTLSPPRDWTATSPAPDMLTAERGAPMPSSAASRQAAVTPVPSPAKTFNNQFKQSRCKLDLRTLVHHKRDEYSEDYRSKQQMMDNMLNESFTVSSDWKPQGILVSHVHEHKDSVSRVLVSPSQDFFITGSRDGSMRVWETYKPDHRLCNISRSQAKYTHKQGQKILDMVFCTANHWVACLNSNGTINLVNVDTGDQLIPSFNTKTTCTVDVDLDGHPTVLASSEFGPRTVINYGTSHGSIVGWDIRSNRNAYTLKHSLSKGLLSSMTSHSQEKWLTVGTSSGCVTLYDLRFHLPVNTIIHPAGYRVNRLVSHPSESSWVVGSVMGNNEISMWNLETKQRQKTLWASASPLLSTKQWGRHWVNGIHLHHTDSKSFLISGGSDMRLRYWDLNNATDSAMFAYAATDPQVNNNLARYKSQVLEDTDCTVEIYVNSAPSSSHLGIDRKRQDKPHPGHHDIITDVAMYHTTHPFIVTASACGVVKVWR